MIHGHGLVPSFSHRGMRDLSEALPLVEQAEAALDVLDKKERFGDGRFEGGST